MPPLRGEEANPFFHRFYGLHRFDATAAAELREKDLGWARTVSQRLTAQRAAEPQEGEVSAS